MNVLFSITYFHPYVSGLTLAASRLAEGLATAGDQVTVLTMKYTSGIRSSAKFRGVRVIRAKPLIKISKGFLSLDWVVQSWHLAQQHDSIVLNLPQFEGVIPALFGRMFGKRVIAIYHCEVITTPIIQWILEISHMISLLLADEIVTYTQDYADSSKLLRLLTLPRSLKMHYIVPPIPKPKENKIFTYTLQKRIGIADFVIGVAARLAREKGVEYLLEALPLVKFQISNPPSERLGTGKSQTNPKYKTQNTKQNIKVVIAGSMEPVGEEAYKKKIMTLVKKYSKQVVFLGEIRPEYMGSFYRLLDVLVLPSVNSTEAFGMVQVEAMRWGVPVVASDLPGVRVPIRKTGGGLLVRPGDSASLARAIGWVLNHRERYRDISLRAERVFRQSESITSWNTVLRG